jgi:Heterokaryon incompatibility protein (HET)
MQKFCPFCRFLVEACELADADKKPETPRNIYFNDHIKDGPWYTVAGIEADLPPVPTAWLGFSSRRDAPQRYICISIVPKAASSEVHNKRAYAYPRRRPVEDNSKDYADYSLIKSWVKVCQTCHPNCCGKSVDFQRQFMKLKLIDVYERVVKLVQDYTPYIALSYVWGEVPEGQERGTRQHKTSSEAILKSGGSYPLPEALPKTIEDALTVVKRLGERYLWVDAYCINQHDKVEAKLQIDNMRLVYECASLTIVAMDGVNAKAGISGVSRPLQQRNQPVVDIHDYRLMATFVDPVSDNHGTTPWESRGWTLQEGVLSRRCVFFDQKHITMRCLQESFHDTMEVDVREDRVPTLQDDRYFWENGFGLDLHSPRWDFLNFDTLVANYSRRKLTRQSDALKACTGILNQITTSTGVGFLCGMPLIDLVRALLWKSHHHSCLSRRKKFPSWSWAGWQGRIEYHYCLAELDLYTNRDEAGEIRQETEKQNSKKRKRVSESGPSSVPNDSAFVLPNTCMNDAADQSLTISSEIACFGLKMIRKQGQLLEHLKIGSSQEKVAVGDQWALLDREGVPLENLVGEVPDEFEETDYSFQTHPDISLELESANGGIECLFMKYWPKLRNSGAAVKKDWLSNMVSALVIMRDKDGATWRVAAVFIKLESWVAADPQPAVVNLR